MDDVDVVLGVDPDTDHGPKDPMVGQRFDLEHRGIDSVRGGDVGVVVEGARCESETHNDGNQDEAE